MITHRLCSSFTNEINNLPTQAEERCQIFRLTKKDESIITDKVLFGLSFINECEKVYRLVYNVVFKRNIVFARNIRINSTIKTDCLLIPLF